MKNGVFINLADLASDN